MAFRPRGMPLSPGGELFAEAYAYPRHDDAHPMTTLSGSGEYAAEVIVVGNGGVIRGVRSPRMTGSGPDGHASSTRWVSTACVL